MPVSFTTSRADVVLIGRIVDRAVMIADQRGTPADPLDWRMTITAAHANGCPMRLDDWLAADDVNFCHDLFGIDRHLDRDTGKLMNFFRPRFAKPGTPA